MPVSPAILYEAFGERYVNEALASIRSLLKHNPDAKVYLYTDAPSPNAEALGVVVMVRDWPAGFLSKVRALVDMPEQRFIWIDTDTRVCASLVPFDRFLDRYGISAAMEPLRDSRRWSPIDLGYREEELFPELNSGVMAVNRSLLPDDFFVSWFNMQMELARRNDRSPAEPIADQYGLRICLGRSDVAPGILPNEFNFRACYPQAVNTTPIIVHCRTPDPAVVEARLCGIDDLTMWLPFGVSLSRGGPVIRGSFAIYRGLEASVRRLRWWA